MQYIFVYPMCWIVKKTVLYMLWYKEKWEECSRNCFVVIRIISAIAVMKNIYIFEWYSCNKAINTCVR